MLSDDFCMALDYIHNDSYKEMHDYCAVHYCNDSCKYHSNVTYNGYTCLMAILKVVSVKILEIERGDPS